MLINVIDLVVTSWLVRTMDADFQVEHVAAGRKRTGLRLCCVWTVETVRISTR